MTFLMTFPHDMVTADLFGQEYSFEYIIENGVPRPDRAS